MPTIDAYLSFEDQCAEAMKFYAKELGGTIDMMMTFGESPMKDQIPPAAAARIMHASLRIGDRVLMASDTFPGEGCMPFEGFKGMALAISYDDVAEATRIVNVLGSNGGKITMPIQETFWVEAFAMVTDKFGVPWLVNGGKAKL